MLISYSVPAMRPYIEAGLRQAAGQDVGSARVKRQTIRGRGPRAALFLARAPENYTHPYDLHHWWKSRAPERALLGVTEGGGYAYPLDILHSFVEPPDAPNYPVVRINGPEGWRDGDATLFWSPGDAAGSAFEREAYADGFDSPEAFRDYFVPNMGDRFDAVLLKW